VPAMTVDGAAAPEVGETERTRLMIVDDDPQVCTVVAEFLQDLGYHVIQASNGNEALGLLERNPNLHMMITDIRMPDMSGIELADAATRRRRSLKVILISGYFVEQGVVKRRFLSKPFRMRDLEAAIRDELNA
jgi:CheY-like chemotaxis protein